MTDRLHVALALGGGVLAVVAASTLTPARVEADAPAIPRVFVCSSPTVTDGDTFRCKDPARSVRLWGVNSVEKGEPGYEWAKAAIRPVIRGGLICTKKGTSYKRVVAKCTNKRGQDVARVLLDQGSVKEWCRYSKGAYGGCA